MRMKEEQLARRTLVVDILAKGRRIAWPTIMWKYACKRYITEAGLNEDENREEWRNKIISYTGDSR